MKNEWFPGLSQKKAESPVTLEKGVEYQHRGNSKSFSLSRNIGDLSYFFMLGTDSGESDGLREYELSFGTSEFGASLVNGGFGSYQQLAGAMRDLAETARTHERIDVISFIAVPLTLSPEQRQACEDAILETLDNHPERLGGFSYFSDGVSLKVDGGVVRYENPDANPPAHSFPATAAGFRNFLIEEADYLPNGFYADLLEHFGFGDAATIESLRDTRGASQRMKLLQRMLVQYFPESEFEVVEEEGGGSRIRILLNKDVLPKIYG